MPSNMPDARAVEEALRRAREMQGRSAHHAPPPPEKVNGGIAAGKCGKRQLKYRRNFRLRRIDLFLLSIRC